MKNKITQIEEEQPMPKEAFENSYPITKEEAKKYVLDYGKKD